MHEDTRPDPAAPITLIGACMAAVHERIASRTLIPGSRLPSIRAFASSLGVSKSTVVEAYERLRAEGIIQSRPGAGYYVSAPLAPLSLAKTEPCLDRTIDPLWISRESLDATSEVFKPGCGWLPSEWMPEASLRRALRKVARSPATTLVDYATAKGLLPLRELLSRRLENAGIAADPADILLTESGTQAIDLLCRCLLKPGDTVLVDDPCYFNFHALLKAHGARVVSVRYTDSGPDITRFEEALLAHGPRLYITNSGIQNPTGATLSADSAFRVLKLAEQFDMRIIEDDIFADFEDSSAVRLAALDGLKRVCLMGSFSKTISASVRCGFIATPADWLEELLDLKIATSFSGGNLAAETTLAILADSSYRRYLEGLRQHLAEQRALVARRLISMDIVPWIMPRAGLYLWCRLPGGTNSTDVARRALTHQVVLAPGNAFSLSRDFSDYLRFNVAQTHHESVYSALELSMNQTRQDHLG